MTRHLKPLTVLLLAMLAVPDLFAQYKSADSCAAFTLQIHAQNHSTDTMRLLYRDCEDMDDYNDTLVLSGGRATVSGKVNRAAEAVLFVDHKNRMMDGPHVLRFILEPGTMSLHFSAAGLQASEVVIKGSAAQQQKERWEQGNASIIKARADLDRRLMATYRAKNPKDSAWAPKRKQLADSMDLLRKEVAHRAFAFAKAEPGSFVSAYFLERYQSLLPVDSLTKYYSLLAPPVRQSDFGKRLLEQIFKLTDDLSFRERYADSAFYTKLRHISSIHDIALTNLKGAKTSLSQYKGKYLLVDFWGSWCGPCFRNVPHLRKLMQELNGMPIEFLSVSMDTEISDWKASVKKHDFPGINLFDDSGILSTYYKVLWVPRYIIIKPDGSVAHLDAPDPDSPELKELLLRLMAEDKRQESLKLNSMNMDNPFIGSWELVSWTARQADGQLLYPYGVDAKGQLLYDAAGNMMVEIMKKDRPLFASNDFLHGSTEEITAAYKGFMAYSGTYDIDRAAGTVTHHVRIGSFPNWVGHDQVRHYTFRDNLLILKSPTMGTAQHELTWKREKSAANR